MIADIEVFRSAFNREGLAIEVDLSLPSARVIRALEQVIEWRGKPKVIRCDNGPEYISGALLGWAERQGIRIEHIQPGKPQQNAYVERYRALEFCYRCRLKHALTKVRVAAADVHPSDCAGHPKWATLAFIQMQARYRSSRTNDKAAVNKAMFSR